MTADKQGKEEDNNRQRNADISKFKESEGRQACRRQSACDDNVWRGTDHGDGAAYVAAIARGISSFDGEIFAAWQIPIITGMRQATVPVLEDTAERAMVTSMIAAMSGTWLVPAFLTTAMPIASARPV